VSVADGVQRRDHRRGELARFLQHRVDVVFGEIAIEAFLERLAEAGRMLEREGDVGNRCAVGHIFDS
jgi:hypothetical protein